MDTTLNSHEDAAFCTECGETVLSVDIPKSLLIKANGSQSDTSQGARHQRTQRKHALRQLGNAKALDWRNRHARRSFDHFDITYLILYPRTTPRADPDNMFPTVKHLIDGMTQAGLWADDSSRHMRARTYQQSHRTTGHKGLWRIEIHITPIGETS